MEIRRFIAIFSLFVVLISTDLAMADGERHPGRHRSEVANDCLKPIRTRGTMGTGFWQNTCDYGVHVKWRVEGEDAGCQSAPHNYMPCLAYVPANSKVTANMSDNNVSGSISWFACRAKDFSSDPWPMIATVNPDKSANMGCYHTGYGPNSKYGNSRKEMKKAVRANWRVVNRSYREYVVERQRQRQLARQRRLKRDRQRELARQRRLRAEEEREEAKWERKLEREREEMRRSQRERKMWNQFGKSVGDLINQRNERRGRHNQPPGSSERGEFKWCKNKSGGQYFTYDKVCPY